MSSGTTSREETPLTCEAVAVQNTIELYVAGQLGESEQAAFEQHYFSCPRCCDELKTYRALQMELLRDPQISSARQRRVPVWAWTSVAAGVLLATAAAVWSIVLGRETPSAPSVAMPSSPAAAPDPHRASAAAVPSAATGDRLSELGRVRAPRYQPPRLRGAGAGDAHFERGMSHYVEGRYQAAIADLRLAATRAPARLERPFYLGASYLMAGNPGAALDHLQVVIAAGESAFLEEARFLAAKALVRKGDLPGARRQLDAVIDLAGDREKEARDLRDEVRALDAATPP